MISETMELRRKQLSRWEWLGIENMTVGDGTHSIKGFWDWSR